MWLAVVQLAAAQPTLGWSSEPAMQVAGAQQVGVSPESRLRSSSGQVGAIAQGPFARPRSRGDSLVNGAIIGGVVGGGLALVDFVRDTSEPGSNGTTVILAVGLGAAIGAGIDALMVRNRGVQRQPRRRRIAISPLMAKGRRGALMTVGF